MKVTGVKQGLLKLAEIKAGLREIVTTQYEHSAKSCRTCETQGACCLDAHFVNVRISRLEAVAIAEVLDTLDEKQQSAVNDRISQTIEKFGLNEGQEFYSCPLFEKGIGCLAHEVKPVPCMQHACYERSEDLPPDALAFDAEEKIERLNCRVYGRSYGQLPLPVWLRRLRVFPKPAARAGHRNQQDEKDHVIPDGNIISEHNLNPDPEQPQGCSRDQS
jgi:hypothetical protein